MSKGNKHAKGRPPVPEEDKRVSIGGRTWRWLKKIMPELAEELQIDQSEWINSALLEKVIRQNPKHVKLLEEKGVLKDIHL